MIYFWDWCVSLLRMMETSQISSEQASRWMPASKSMAVALTVCTQLHSKPCQAYRGQLQRTHHKVRINTKDFTKHCMHRCILQPLRFALSWLLGNAIMPSPRYRSLISVVLYFQRKRAITLQGILTCQGSQPVQQMPRTPALPQHWSLPLRHSMSRSLI